MVSKIMACSTTTMDNKPLHAKCSNTGDVPIATAVQIIHPDQDCKTPTLTVNLPARGGSHTEDMLRERQLNLLKDQGFTTGLAKALYETKTKFPLRIWVVDNSGSMQNSDGKRFVAASSVARTNSDRHPTMKVVPCTRWAELQECVTYHIELSGLIKAPTSFRLLNDSGAVAGHQYFDVASNGDDLIQSGIEEAHQIISTAKPGGVTPLTNHINEVRESVSELKDELLQRGQRVSLILATDGLPTDSNGNGGKEEQQKFIESLRSLEGLPMWIVIRLCTDEDAVVKFYSELLDYELELSMEVLDDFASECKEIRKHNKWLNYALPLHRTREMGFHDRVFDLLDERQLTHQELHQFCLFLFGVDRMDGVIPDPASDWAGFMRHISLLNDTEAQQWNPIKKKVLPWIDIKKLNKVYGESSSCTIM